MQYQLLETSFSNNYMSLSFKISKIGLKVACITIVLCAPTKFVNLLEIFTLIGNCLHYVLRTQNNDWLKQGFSGSMSSKA